MLRRFIHLLLIYLICSAFLNAATLKHERTYSIKSLEDLSELYQKEVDARPEYYSMCTGQPEDFLAYELIARAVVQKFSPGYLNKMQMQNQTVLRYPSENAPKNLKELFLKFPIEEDYDTATSASDYLISCSPSLRETEPDESAFGIFQVGERGEIFPDLIEEIFLLQGVPKKLFKRQIQVLIAERPLTGIGGVLTQIFLPKDSAIHKYAYVSFEYGIPAGEPKNPEEIKEFFQLYEKGLWPEQPPPQLRLLSSVFHDKGQFRLGSPVQTVRYTYVDEESLDAYAKKVDEVVTEIWEKWQHHMMASRLD